MDTSLRLGRRDPLGIEDEDQLLMYKSAESALREDVLPRSRPAAETQIPKSDRVALPSSTAKSTDQGKPIEYKWPGSEQATQEPRTDQAAQKSADGSIPYTWPGSKPIEPEPVAKPTEDTGDVMRGAGTALAQTPALAYGALGYVGAVGENLFGTGGSMSSLKKFGLNEYQTRMKEIGATAKDTDDVTKAWAKAKGGDMGALVDWAQYGVGYLGGNIVETVATSAIGSVVGGLASGPVAPVGALGGAVAGVVGRDAVKGVAKNLIEGMVAKEAARIAEKAGVETATGQMLKEATKNVAKNIGSGMALAGSSLIKETGGIYGEAEEQAKKEGRELDGGDLARIFGSGVVAGLSEFAVDKLGLDVAAGKIKIPGGGRTGRSLIGGVAGVGLEGGTELFQTAVERYGAGKTLTGEDAMNEYINAFALGGLGGGTVGAVVGAFRDGKTSPDRVRQILDQAQSDMTSDDGRQELFDSMFDDPKLGPILQANGIESGDDPRFQNVITRALATQRMLVDLEAPTPEARAETRKQREADVLAAFGETASTAVGGDTGAIEPVIQRSSVTPNLETRTLEGEAQPVILPETAGGQAGTVALSPEDLVARQQGFEPLVGITTDKGPVGNRFPSMQAAEFFLLGPKDAKTGQRSGGYAQTNLLGQGLEARIRQGKRSKAEGGGTFYFVETRKKPETPAPVVTPAAPVTTAAAPVVTPAVTPTAPVTPTKGKKATIPALTPEEEQQQIPLRVRAEEIANELETLGGDKNLISGIRSVITNKRRIQNNDFYEGKLAELKALKGAGVQKTTEQRGVSAYFTESKRDQGRYNEYKGNADIGPFLQSADDAIQQLTTFINNLGYAVADVNNATPDKRALFAKSMMSQIAGSTSRMLVKREAFDKKYKSASLEQKNKSLVDLQKDLVAAQEYLTKQGEPDATQTRQVTEGGEQQRQGAGEQVPAVGEDRGVKAEEQTGGGEAGRGDQPVKGGAKPQVTKPAATPLPLLVNPPTNEPSIQVTAKGRLPEQDALLGHLPISVLSAPENIKQAMDVLGASSPEMLVNSTIPMLQRRGNILAEWEVRKILGNKPTPQATAPATPSAPAKPAVDPAMQARVKERINKAYEDGGLDLEDVIKLNKMVDDGDLMGAISNMKRIVESNLGAGSGAKYSLSRTPQPTTTGRDFAYGKIKTIDDLNRDVRGHLARQGSGGTFTATRVPLGNLAGKVPGLPAMQRIADLFGKKLVYFAVEKGSVDLIDGAVLSGSDTIFVNVNSSRPHIRILGHEMVHALRFSNKEIYTALTKHLSPYLDQGGMNAYAAQLGKEGMKDPALILEEAIADIVGDRFGESTFWQMMADENPSMFTQLARIVVDFLDSVMNRIRGQKTLDSKNLLTDVAAARQAIVSVLADFDARSAAPAKPTGAPSFSRGRTGSAGVLAEVAPNPDQEIASRWNEMTAEEKTSTTQAVANKMMTQIFNLLDLEGFTYRFSSGRYEGDVNPNILIDAPPNASVQQLELLAKVMGYVLDQKAMVAYDENNTTSGDQAGFVKVEIPKGMSEKQFDDMRQHISDRVPQADSDTLRDGALIFGNFSAYNDNVETLTDDQYRAAIRDAIESFDYDGEIRVSQPETFHSQFVWPENREAYLQGTEYGEGSGLQGGEGANVRRSRRDRIDDIAEQAIAIRDKWIDARGAARAGRRAQPNQVAVGEPDAEYGTPRQGAIEVVAVHYSQVPRRVLSSSFFGTGLRGAEKGRLAEPTNADIKNRIYTYVDIGYGIRPEAGVGGAAHVIKLKNIYDVTKDELGLSKGARGRTEEEIASSFERAVLRAGFDGYYTAPQGSDKGYAVLIGDHQIEINPPAEAPMFSRKREGETFYSAMERGFESVKQTSMPAQQWKAWLNSNKEKLGIKKAEIEWTGINEWLDLQQGKVEKQEVLNWIAGNKVRINDIILTDNPSVALPEYKDPTEEDYREFVREKIEEQKNNVEYGTLGLDYNLEEEYPELYKVDPDSMTMEEAKQWIKDYSSMTVFNREHIRGYERSLGRAKDRLKARYNKSIGSIQTVLPGGEDYAEIILTDPSIQPYKEEDTIHFGDIAYGKHIGWLRTNVRKDAEGNDVLFLEEIQSQRAQEGREFGIFDSKRTELPAGFTVYQDFGSLARPKNASWYVINDSTKKQVGIFGRTKEEAIESALRSGVPEAPFIEDTKSWASLLLKRAIAYAQTKGIDRVAWTTGDQQNERYRLSKVVDEIYYDAYEDGTTYEVTAIKDGDEITQGSGQMDIGAIRRAYGKDVAKLISNGSGDQAEGNVKVIRGENLDVGGAGMREFYNTIVPSVAKTIAGKDSVTVMDIEWTGQQLGFVIPEKLQEQVANDGFPMFSRKRYEEQFSDLDDKTRATAMRKGYYSPPTIKERLDHLKPRLWDRIIQGTFDKFRAVRGISEKAYMMLRMSSGSQDGAVSALLHYGQVYDDDGALNVKKGTKGLLEALDPVGGEVDRFLLWIAANRAANLSKDERERFFSQEDIRQLQKLNMGTMKNGKSRIGVYAEALKNMNELNRSVLDLARTTGLIDADAYKRFSADIWYVPFYRQMEDDGSLSAAQTSSGAVGQYLSKKLKGSDRPLNDLMENVLMNWSHILSASMKNKAAVETLKAATDMGDIVTKLPAQMKGAVKVMEGGKETYYMIEDEFLLASLSAVSQMPSYGFWMDTARGFKTTLTRFISLSPTFKINNLIRDSIQSIGLSELSNNPLGNVMQGWRAYKTDRAEALAGGGLFAMGNAFDGDQSASVKRLLKTGVNKADILDTPEKVASFFRSAQDKYDEISDASENANRLALYQQLRAKGASHLEAAYAARDLQDFSLQGSWTAIRYAAQVLPYFNARLQGMYKLGRDGLDPTMQVLTGKASDTERQKAAKFATVTGAVVTAALILYLSQKDDEDWKKREDWDRDAFFWFKIPGTDKAVRIPKPFEMGAIATITERALEQMVDSSVEGKVFGKRLLHVLSDNFAINPIPQFIRPIYDVARNKDGFTDRPIESMGMERISVENRVSPGTSGAAIAISKVNNMFAEFASKVTGGAINTQSVQLSPIQYDYMIKGYLGWVGTGIQTASNVMAAPFKDGASSRYERIDDFLVVGNYVKTVPQAQSRYVTSFYENAKDVATASSDVSHFLNSGQLEKAREIYTEKADRLALAKLYNKGTNMMSDISKQIKMVEDDKTMSGAEKRLEIERLQQIRIQIAKNVEDMRIGMKNK